MLPSITPTVSAYPSITPCENGSVLFELELLTDEFGEETSWTIYDANDMAIVSVDYFTYADTTLYHLGQCLSPGTFVFTIEDYYGDGIEEPGYYVLYLDGIEIARGRVFEFSDSIAFQVA